MTQIEAIVEYMRKHGGITQSEATTYIGCSRLAARISDIKHLGYPVHRVMISGKNRYGEKVSFAKYFLEA